MTDYEGLNIVEMPYAVGRYQTTRYSLVKLIPKQAENISYDVT